MVLSMATWLKMNLRSKIDEACECACPAFIMASASLFQFCDRCLGGEDGPRILPQPPGMGSYAFRMKILNFSPFRSLISELKSLSCE